ncbi:MAG TPA: DUF5615 family PIN-like protein [Thermomicrobiales bacterium]|nr:DUF5615 family PIN-like protein [Thermomicrobiales bacterium]
MDENLPDRLIPPTSRPVHHARELGTSLTDSALWAAARREHWAIVSKDADFAARIAATNPPPWVVHLRIGNLRLAEFAAFVVQIWPQVEAMLPAHKLVNVYRDRIEAMSDSQGPNDLR